MSTFKITDHITPGQRRNQQDRTRLYAVADSRPYCAPYINKPQSYIYSQDTQSRTPPPECLYTHVRTSNLARSFCGCASPRGVNTEFSSLFAVNTSPAASATAAGIRHVRVREIVRHKSKPETELSNQPTLCICCISLLVTQTPQMFGMI